MSLSLRRKAAIRRPFESLGILPKQAEQMPYEPSKYHAFQEITGAIDNALDSMHRQKLTGEPPHRFSDSIDVNIKNAIEVAKKHGVTVTNVVGERKIEKLLLNSGSKYSISGKVKELGYNPPRLRKVLGAIAQYVFTPSVV